MANDLFLQFDHAFSLRSGKTVWRRFYDHKTGRFSEHKKVEPSKYIIVSGLHPYYIRSMREITDIKIYLDTEYNLMTYWKVKRDIAERNYPKEQAIESIKTREHDNAKYIEPQKKFADLVVRYEPVNELGWEELNDQCNVRGRFFSDNSINFERLFAEMRQVSTLKVDHQYEDADKQCLTVEGDIASEQLREISSCVIPNLRELVDSKMHFEEGLKGITQLVFLTVLNHFKIYAKV